jgi:hypothetical protein
MAQETSRRLLGHFFRVSVFVPVALRRRVPSPPSSWARFGWLVCVRWYCWLVLVLVLLVAAVVRLVVVVVVG